MLCLPRFVRMVAPSFTCGGRLCTLHQMRDVTFYYEVGAAHVHWSCFWCMMFQKSSMASPQLEALCMCVLQLGVLSPSVANIMGARK